MQTEGRMDFLPDSSLELFSGALKPSRIYFPISYVHWWGQGTLYLPLVESLQ